MTDVMAEVERRAKEVDAHRNLPLGLLIAFVNDLGFRVMHAGQSTRPGSKDLRFTCRLGSDEGATYYPEEGEDFKEALSNALLSAIKWNKDASPSMLASNGQGYRHLHDFTKVNPKATMYPGLEATKEPEQEQVQRPVIRERPAPTQAPKIRERVKPAQPGPDHEQVQRSPLQKTQDAINSVPGPVLRQRVRSPVPPVEVTVRERVRPSA
jgi:hypothetical protein